MVHKTHTRRRHWDCRWERPPESAVNSSARILSRKLVSTYCTGTCRNVKVWFASESLIKLLSQNGVVFVSRTEQCVALRSTYPPAGGSNNSPGGCSADQLSVMLNGTEQHCGLDRRFRFSEITGSEK